MAGRRRHVGFANDRQLTPARLSFTLPLLLSIGSNLKDKATMDDRLTYHVDEAAEITGLSRSTLYRLAARKELPLIKVCGRTLIARADLEAMIARMRTPIMQPAGAAR